jgi:hypothetical protein
VSVEISLANKIWVAVVAMVRQEAGVVASCVASVRLVIRSP